MSAPELLADLARHGIHLEADGERLRFYPRSAVTPELLAGLRQFKTELLTLLARDAGAVQTVTITPGNDHGAGDLADDAHAHDHDRALALEPIDVPEPCSTCGGIAVWWDLLGGEHCMACNPPTRSRRLAEAAARIRARKVVRR